MNQKHIYDKYYIVLGILVIFITDIVSSQQNHNDTTLADIITEKITKPPPVDIVTKILDISNNSTSNSNTTISPKDSIEFTTSDSAISDRSDLEISTNKNITDHVDQKSKSSVVSSATTRTLPHNYTIPVTEDGSYTSCVNHTVLDTTQQPTTSPTAKLKKCCPLGMNYRTINGTHVCAEENVPFEVPAKSVIFYEDCIEDMEQEVNLDYEIGFPCPGSEAFIYNQNYGDNLYVIQNGSLLRIDEDFSSFDVFNAYCLDMDRETKQITAMVCNQTNGRMVHVSKAQSYVYAICMLTSVPCLIVTAFFYLSIQQLRDLHGKSLACHCICLAMGFFILSVAQIRGTVTQTVGFVIQYFILACFFWLAVMCMDICVQVWYYIPKKKRVSTMANLFRFIFYGVLCQGLPLILVLLSASKELPGMPSYYLKGITEATRSSQQYFIPPISTTLFICCLFLIISFFGFRELDPIVSKLYIYKMNIESENMKINLDVLDIDHYESTKQIAKSTAYLYTIMTLNWIFEIISFYVHTAEASLVLFDIMNALQGIVIFIIFVCLPQPLHIIKRWWMDRGSLDLSTANMTELEILNNGTVRN